MPKNTWADLRQKSSKIGQRGSIPVVDKIGESPKSAQKCPTFASIFPFARPSKSL